MFFVLLSLFGLFVVGRLVYYFMEEKHLAENQNFKYQDDEEDEVPFNYFKLKYDHDNLSSEDD